jgi:RHS repeat-associated protein
VFLARVLPLLLLTMFFANNAQAAGVAISLTPSGVDVSPGGTATLTATVTGSTNSAVTWTVDGALNGNTTVGALSGGAAGATPKAFYYTAYAMVQSGISVLAGDLIFIAFNVGNSPGTTTCSDSDGNTYHRVGGDVFSNLLNCSAYAFYTIAQHSVTGLTATISTVNDNPVGIFGLVVSGLAADATLDQVAITVDSAAAITHHSGSITTTDANEFAIAFWVQNTDWARLEDTAGFSVLQSDDQGDAVTGKSIPTSGTLIEDVITTNVSVPMGCILATFKETVCNTVTYTAPTIGGTHTIVATSVADSTKHASSTVTVGSGVTVSISPATANISAGSTTSLTAAVTGTLDTAVTWAVDGIANGNAMVGTLSSSSTGITPKASYYTAYALGQSGISVQVGDLVLIGWVVGNSPGTTSCSDSDGNTYCRVGNDAHTPLIGCSGYMFYTIAQHSVTNLTTTINSVNTNPIGIFALVVSGLQGNGTLDQVAVSIDSEATRTHGSAQVTTTTNNEYAISLWFENTAWAVLSDTAGFTLFKRDGQADALLGKFIPAAGTVVKDMATTDVAVPLGNVIATFKEMLCNTTTYTAPAGGGSHIITATSVADPTQSASARVISTPDPSCYPHFGNGIHPVFQVGVPSSVTLPEATDPNGSPLSYQVTNLPAGLAFDPSTRALSGTLANPGTYTLTYTATNGLGLPATATVNLVAGFPPVLGTTGAPVVPVGIPSSFTLPVASDPNGSNLSYEVSDLPSYLAFTPSTRTVAGTFPSLLSATFTYTVRNGLGLSTTGTITITPMVATTPVIGAVGDVVFQAGVAASYVLPTATDPFGAALSYQVLGLPGGLTFSPDTRAISGVVATAGTYSFTYIATDSFGLSSSSTTPLAVAGAPVLGTPPTVEIQIGRNSSFSLPTAIDPVGATLTYQVSGLPSGLSFNPTNKTVSGSLFRLGTYSFNYTVTNSFGLAATGSIILTVSPRADTLLSVSMVNEYTYDNFGRLSTIVYPSSNQVTYTYDDQDRIIKVMCNGQNIAQQISYDGWSNQCQLLFGSSALDQWTYEASGTHLVQWAMTAQDFMQSWAYQYDDAGHLSQAGGQIGEWSSLQYDPNSRLTLATGFGFTNTFSYDAFDNNISSVSTGNVPPFLNNFTFGPEPNNRILGLAANGGSTDVGWSEFGEMTQVATGISTNKDLSFAWDDLGVLARCRFSSSSLIAQEDYRYDANGFRATRADSTSPALNRLYNYNSTGQLLSEYVCDGLIALNREVIYVNNTAIAEIDGMGTLHELHSDYLGTPRIITNSVKVVEGSQALAPYGELIQQTGYIPLTGFTGHLQQEPNGLIYMRGRYYSPAWHVFLNSNQGQDPNQLNQYAYCGGNPMMVTDPSGYDAGGLRGDSNAFNASRGYGEHGIGGDGSSSDVMNRWMQSDPASRLLNGDPNAMAALDLLMQSLERTKFLNKTDLASLSISDIDSMYTRDLAQYHGTVLGGLIGNALGQAMANQESAPNPVKSTGRTSPTSLKEQLAMEQAMSDPAAGKVIPGVTMSDYKNGWLANSGWVKMGQNINGVEVHYVMNTKTGAVADFKFK